MITEKQYKELKSKIGAFDAWVETKRNKRGWASYRDCDVPAYLERVSDDERSSVEAYEFVHEPPDTYFVYVQRDTKGPGLLNHAVTVTTWTGEVLGRGKLGPMYKSGPIGHRSLRYPITFKGINGHTYRGTFYHSSGDYARVKRVKE